MTSGWLSPAAAAEAAAAAAAAAGSARPLCLPGTQHFCWQAPTFAPRLW